jgi:Cu-processing system ATP-binding protein
MRAPNPAIELAAVSKRYGAKQVVDEVDLAVEQGECLALLGHNGAGKTTLMKLMLGLTRPSAGQIRVQGEDPGDAGAAQRRSRLGYLPENVVFHDAMTGREVLTFYARLKQQPPRLCEELLERVGLGAAAGRRVRTYSKGMRQRLGLAQALLGDPRLLFLDEPTTGLDPALRRQFYQQLGELRRQGVTTLISSHALTEIESRSNRVAIMNRGRLLVSGTLEDLRQRARLPVRLHLTVAAEAQAGLIERLGPDLSPERGEGAILMLRCQPDDKMALLRRVAELGPVVRDLEIHQPGLEDLYAHFSDNGDPQ